MNLGELAGGRTRQPAKSAAVSRESVSDDRGASRRAVLAATATAAVAGCVAPTRACEEPVRGGFPAATGRPSLADVELTVLVENLEIPWDLAFAPTGELFVTERTGRILRFAADDLTTVVEPDDIVDARALPPGSDEKGWWMVGGADGVHGVAVHPSYPDPAYVYAYYAYRTGGGQYNKLVRYDVDADPVAASAVILLDGVPGGDYHNGGRIAFGPHDRLWVTTGDAGRPHLAQDTASLAGNVLRVTADGDPAAGNPRLPGSGADPRIYTYGHRNPQGLTWLPDGTPLNTEHGPGGHDEVNVLRPGANYGWPNAWTGEQYRSHPAYTPPVLNTGIGTWAPSGCVFYTGGRVPRWRNRLLVGTLRAQQLKIVTLSACGGSPLFPSLRPGRYFDADWLDDSFSAVAHGFLEDRLGRIRAVAQGPDGSVYATTSNRDGRPRDPFPLERDDVLVRMQ